MRSVLRALVVALALVLLGGAALVFLISRRGLSTRAEPTFAEAWLARQVRRWAAPAELRNATNPVPLDAETLAEARAHFADHCAICHANDGSGETGIGRNLYPRAPDMRKAATQDLSDGELFAIIKHGVRLTGMPAWGEDTPADDRQSWALVHFVRHLPRITKEEIAEMEALNPRPPQEVRDEIEAERFLQGEDRPSRPEAPAHRH